MCFVNLEQFPLLSTGKYEHKAVNNRQLTILFLLAMKLKFSIDKRNF